MPLPSSVSLSPNFSCNHFRLIKLNDCSMIFIPVIYVVGTAVSIFNCCNPVKPVPVPHHIVPSLSIIDDVVKSARRNPIGLLSKYKCQLPFVVSEPALL